MYKDDVAVESREKIRESFDTALDKKECLFEMVSLLVNNLVEY
jgi:hypothetical protein